MQKTILDKFRLASDYLLFRAQARSRFTIHSPFLFELVNEVFRDKRSFYCFDEIEKIRGSLLADATLISENHYGEKSKVLDSRERSLRDIARTASLPAEYGELLFRLVNHFRPENILELGTGTGISTLYLASAAAAAPVTSLEGSPTLSKIAQRNLSKLSLNNVQIITGNFADTLPVALQQLGKPGFIFIDGDHRKSPLLDYIHQCLPGITPHTIMVLDDIYWSQEMKEAWQEIIELPQVTMSIDLFRMGILFFKEGIVKQHLKVVAY